MLERIDLGAAADDGSGDSLRLAFEKVNQNFEQLTALLLQRMTPTASAATWPGDFVPRHITDRPPDAAPPMLGALWLDLSQGALYISTGTGSVADWRQLVLAEPV